MFIIFNMFLTEVDLDRFALSCSSPQPIGLCIVSIGYKKWLVWWGMVATLTCGYKDKVRNVVKKSSWPTKVGVVGSFLRFMTSLVLGS